LTKICCQKIWSGAKKVVTLHSQNGDAACDCDGERVLRPGPGLEEGERRRPWRQEDIDRMLQDKSSKLLRQETREHALYRSFRGNARGVAVKRDGTGDEATSNRIKAIRSRPGRTHSKNRKDLKR